MNLTKTKEFAKILRLHALNMTSKAGSSHIGSMFSIADIVAVLFNDVLKIKPKNPNYKLRDRFILSKGHSGGIIYAALAEKGFFSKKKLEDYCKNGSNLSGHISHHRVSGVEFSTGSLGHGLSVSCGIALANLRRNVRVFNLMSDGELDEGSNWEAFMFASHHKLSNLINIIDYNKLQSIETVKKTLNLEPLESKLVSFGWKVFNVDGHNHKQIYSKIRKKKTRGKRKPICIIAHTIKGKGVKFMENNNLWHYRTAKNEELKKAIKYICR